MKSNKCLPIAAIALVIFILLCSFTIKESEGEFSSNYIKIFVDGRQLDPRDVNGGQVHPILQGGTTYVPIRAVSEAFNKDISWDGSKYTVDITTKYRSYKEVIYSFRPSDVNMMLTYDNTDFHYTEVDINGDSVKELLIYDRQMKMGSIFTKIDENVKKINLPHTGATGSLYITPDNFNVFAITGSSRSVGNYSEYFTIENGERNVFAEHRSEYVDRFSVPYFIVNGERVEDEVFITATEGLLKSKYELKPGIISVDYREVSEAFLDSLLWTRIDD